MNEISESERVKRRRRNVSEDPWNPASNAKSLVLSLAKGFRILEVFDTDEPELSLSEVAKRAHLDTGTTFRLIKTLVMLGYLQHGDGAKRYRLGLKIINLGFTTLARRDWHSLARPVLRSLVGPIIEAASIGVLDGPDAVYVERVQAGLSSVGVTRGIGSRVPAYCSAVGHAILAHMPLEDRLKVLNQRERIRLTAHTPVAIAEIEARLSKVRELGYSLSDQSLVLGVRALAAPILDRDGHPLASLSCVSVSFSSSPEEFVAATANQVVAAARAIGQAISLSGASAGILGATTKR